MSSTPQWAPSAPNFYTKRLIAEELHVSERTIARLIESGQLAAVRVGRSIRIPRQSVEDYLSRNAGWGGAA